MNYQQACKLLGGDGSALIRQGGQWEIVIEEQVKVSPNQFMLVLGDVHVVLVNDPSRLHSIHANCSHCESPCEHLGAAFSLILEEKLSLGLSVPPPDRIPVESLSPSELIEQALAERGIAVG